MSADDSDLTVTTDEYGLPHFTKPPSRPTEGNLLQHAWDELNRAGLFTEKGDFYGGMTGRSVMELIETFDKHDHSGMSAGIVIDLFTKLASFQPLSPPTDDPEEWFEHEGFGPDGESSLWQNKRKSDAFSADGGKTYRVNGDPDTVHTSEPAKD